MKIGETTSTRTASLFGHDFFSFACLILFITQAEHLRQIIKPDFVADDDVVGTYLDDLCRDPADRLAYLPPFWLSYFHGMDTTTETGLRSFAALLQESRNILKEKVIGLEAFGFMLLTIFLVSHGMRSSQLSRNFHSSAIWTHQSWWSLGYGRVIPV